MANILITYADKNFTNSLWLIKRRAKKLGIFVKVIAYSPESLPEYVKSSPLMAQRAGGFVWKPFIVYDALRRANIGDVIYYMDAGCQLQQSDDWTRYAQMITDHDALFFAYRGDHDYQWHKWKHNSVKIRHWCKPTTADFFAKYFNDDSYLNFNTIWAGFMIVKKTEQTLQVLTDWLDLSLMHPELLKDPYGPEKLSLPETYCAHRHDQTILTFLAHYYKDKENIMIIDETSESSPATAAVVAARYRVGKMPLIDTVKFRIYHTLKSR